MGRRSERRLDRTRREAALWPSVRGVTTREEGDAMTESLGRGDRVSWNTSQGRTRGVVEERRVEDFDSTGRGSRHPRVSPRSS
ncbi:DUF2945 domain-containing protein [Microbacterium sp. LBN7]